MKASSAKIAATETHHRKEAAETTAENASTACMSTRKIPATVKAPAKTR